MENRARRHSVAKPRERGPDTQRDVLGAKQLKDTSADLEASELALQRSQTALHASQIALNESLATTNFLESILNASQDCIKVLDGEGKVIFMNDGGRSVMEVDDFETIRACAWVGFWEGEGRIAAEAALMAAARGEVAKFRGSANTAKGIEKFWDVTVTRLAAEGDAENLYLSISKDISAERELEQHRDMMIRESSHRVKNILAVVQAVAAQTLGEFSGPKLNEFYARLSALAKAQQMLLDDNASSLQLRDVVESALRPVCDAGRRRINGPDIALSPNRALALAMALHELSTNAIKYGAFSNGDGEVAVDWQLEGVDLVFEWRETGGPPIVEPAHKGFGTRVMTRNLEAHFQGQVARRFEKEGLHFRLRARLS